jgi:hypothetical protein
VAVKIGGLLGEAAAVTERERVGVGERERGGTAGQWFAKFGSFSYSFSFVRGLGIGIGGRKIKIKRNEKEWGAGRRLDPA